MNPQEENKVASNNPVVAPKEPAKKTGDFLISPLRTYEDDVKNAVQNNNISTAKILMAEQQKRQKEQADFEQNSPTSKTNVVKISLSISFIVLGLGIVGAGYYFYSQSTKTQIDAPVVVNANKIIDTETEVMVDTTNKTNREVIGEIRKTIRNSSTEIKENDLREIRLTKIITTEKDGKEFSNKVNLETNDFFSLLESREPDALVRSLDKEFLLGIQNTKNKIEPFIIFKVNDFEISYAKMLEWENVLISDVKDIFFENLGSSQSFINEEIPQTNQENTQEEPVINATSTEIATTTNATSTQQVTKALNYNEKDFKDLILANKDTRVIFDKDGKILFFYTFLNRNYLVLTTNLETLNTIITRTNSAKLIR